MTEKRTDGRPKAKQPRADAVIVLGAALTPAGGASPALRRRVARGVDVLVAEGISHLLLSGGGRAPPPSEAQVMAELARGAGIAENRLVLEDRSRNTFENALYSGRIMGERGWRRVILVTDPFHLPRALLAFRCLGLRAEGRSVRRPRDVSRRTWLKAYGRETVSLIVSAWLFLRGRHRPLVQSVWGRERT